MTRDNSSSAATRKKKTRTALRSAMLDLLCEMPFERIQITDLTARAHVGYATFYRHYDATEDLLNEIAGDQIEQLLGMTIPVMAQYDSSVSLRALCQFVQERRDLWRALLAGGAAHTVRAEFVRQARKWADASDRQDTDVPVDLGTVCAAGSTIDALAWWMEEGADRSVDEMAEYINRLNILPFVGDHWAGEHNS